MKQVRTSLLLVGLLTAPAMLSGCVNILSMGFATPIPVPVWVPERMEEKYCRALDKKTPIMPPIPPGHRPLCEDPPDPRSILAAMPKPVRGIPYVCEEHRDDLDFAVEKIADHIDPPRFYPLVGPAQLHHCHWKCTVFYTETHESSYPFPFQCKRRRSQVVYIDRDHLHQVVPTPEARMSVTRDLVGPIP